MKGWTLYSVLLSLGLMASNPAALRAQDAPPTGGGQAPVVTVMATTASASEDGPVPGTFQVSRTGDTTSQLTVYYSLGGTAKNGVDFQMLPGWVTSPSGSASANVTVTPILDFDHSPRTNDTVVLQLHPLVDIPIGRVGLYAVGWPSNAVVTITETSTPPTNPPPVVHIVSPSDGAGFLTPVNIQLVAQASDPDGTVSSVEFFAATSKDTNSLGVVNNTLSGDPFHNLFSLIWTNPPPNDYVITAKATDNQGATTTSDSITIHVASTANLPVVTVAATTANASEDGPVAGVFTVSRSGDTSGALAVYYSLSGTAQNGFDYQHLPGVVNFAAGSATALVTVTPIPDLDFTAQTSDTVVLQLRALADMDSGVVGLYTIGSPSNATVTITESSASLPVVTVKATAPNASEDGPAPGTFQVSRSGDSSQALTVYYSLSGNAKNGADYKMLPGYVTFAPGDTDTNINVTPIHDADRPPETNDTVVLQLRAPLEPLPLPFGAPPIGGGARDYRREHQSHSAGRAPDHSWRRRRLRGPRRYSSRG
jgi:hypothetical protein